MNRHDRLCDYCGKIVAEKLILWHTKEPYTRLRTDEPVTYVNQEDNTTLIFKHMCNDCLENIRTNLRAEHEVIALRNALKQSEEIREYYEAVAANLGHELNQFRIE